MTTLGSVTENDSITTNHVGHPATDKKTNANALADASLFPKYVLLDAESSPCSKYPIIQKYITADTDILAQALA